MADRDSLNGFAIGFFIGAIAGMVIGFLYAPQPGRETRALLREKAGEVREKAGEITEKAKEMSSGTVKKVKGKSGAKS
jgi:gas vesicle protein